MTRSRLRPGGAAGSGCPSIAPQACQAKRMAMREDCRHFQSRTYTSGEVARFCVLDLAPEAPWRCPANCPRYEKGLTDATSVVGSLARSQVEAEPEAPEGEVASVLEAAELIVTADEAEIVKQVDHERETRPRWKLWGRREQGGPHFGDR